MQRTFLPDSTRSGRWQSQPEQGEPSHRHSSAGAVLEAMTTGNDILPELHQPNLEAPVEDVEQPESDVEEPDAEDEERDDLQARAAEVHTAAAHAQSKEPENKPGHVELAFSPTFAEKHKLESTVIRHLFRGTRHWCANGKHIICDKQPNGCYNKCESGPATTHNDAFCINCLRAARSQYDVKAPERFVHGEPVQEEGKVADNKNEQHRQYGLLNAEQFAQTMRAEFGPTEPVK